MFLWILPELNPKTGNVTILYATDYQFGGDIKRLINDEDGSEYSLGHEDFIGNWELYKDSLLSDSDKLYLKTILNLHKDYKATIFLKRTQEDYYYIGIIFVRLDNGDYWHTALPPFKKYTRFKNLELYTPYTLNQLDLKD